MGNLGGPGRGGTTVAASQGTVGSEGEGLAAPAGGGKGLHISPGPQPAIGPAGDHNIFSARKPPTIPATLRVVTNVRRRSMNSRTGSP